MEKVDRRVQKTNRALIRAFKELAETMSYNAITIKKLTETAHINRKTFYLHYDSIDDFSNALVDRVSEKLIKMTTDKPLAESLSTPGYIFEQIFDFFQESRDFYTFMLSSMEYSFLSRKVENKVSEALAKAIYKEFDISKLDAYICASFMSRNTLMLFRMYSDEKIDLDKNELKDRLVRLNTNGLSSFMDIKHGL